MPNWCNNKLEIQGSKKEVAKVLEFIGNKKDKDYKHLDFNKITPMPEELRNTTSPTPKGKETEAKKLQKKYGATDWYHWSIDNWGTKWNCNGARIEEDAGDKNLTIGFETAWSPPIPIVLELGKKFPKINFKLDYVEPGMCFAGSLNVQGEDVNDEQYDNGSEAYKSMEEEFGYGTEEWEEMFKEKDRSDQDLRTNDE